MMNTAILVLVSLFALAVAGTAFLTLQLLMQIRLLVIRRRWTRSIPLPPITAYTPSPSYTVGSPIPIHLHTTRPATARLLRLGATAQPVDWTRSLPATQQSSEYDYWQGLLWPVTFTIDSHELTPGMYLVQFEHTENRSANYSVVFLLCPATVPEVAVIIATNTWQAYNDFGGLSNYRDSVTPFPLSVVTKIMKALSWQVRLGERHFIPAIPLPEQRPNAILEQDFRALNDCPAEVPSHVGRGDWALVRFLESEQVPYGLFSDRDLVFDTRPTAARLVIFGAHSEYWSHEMAAVYLSYLARGGKVLFVSGNNAYRHVTLLDRALLVTNFRVDSKEMAHLTGLAYDARGYETFCGFRVRTADHWAFAGLDVGEGDIFGAGSDGRGASGWETDKLHPAGGPCTILAIGCNAEGPGFIICREQVNGGWIVNLGSVASAAWVGKDRIVGGIVRNVIRRALQT